MSGEIKRLLKMSGEIKRLLKMSGEIKRLLKMSGEIKRLLKMSGEIKRLLKMSGEIKRLLKMSGERRLKPAGHWLVVLSIPRVHFLTVTEYFTELFLTNHICCPLADHICCPLADHICCPLADHICCPWLITYAALYTGTGGPKDQPLVREECCPLCLLSLDDHEMPTDLPGVW